MSSELFGRTLLVVAALVMGGCRDYARFELALGDAGRDQASPIDQSFADGMRVPPVDLRPVDLRPVDLRPGDLIQFDAATDLSTDPSELCAATILSTDGAIFCEHFEASTLPAGWTKSVVSESATIPSSIVDDGTEHQDGMFALYSTVTPKGGSASVKHGLPSLGSTANVWVRAFFYLPHASTTYNDLLDLSVGTTDVLLTWNPKAPIKNALPGGIQLMVGGTNAVTYQMVFMPSKWTCISWHFTANTSDVFVDDTAALPTSTYDNALNGSVNAIGLGQQTAISVEAAQSYWIDDLVVSTHQVSCLD